MIEIIAILIVVFFAVFVQASAAFGTALVAMPLLTALVGIAIAAPLVTITTFTCQLFMIRRYRAHFRFADMRSLIYGAVVGVMIGSLLVGNLHHNARLVERLLGGFVVVYVVFSLVRPRLPPLKNPAWGYGLGLLAGILARVYNVGGPPGVIYADRQGWQPTTFKGNLQLYALINSLLVIISRTINAEYTPMVLNYYMLVIPAILLGLFAGFLLEKRINSALFRKVVLALLLVIGIMLVV